MDNEYLCAFYVTNKDYDVKKFDAKAQRDFGQLSGEQSSSKNSRAYATILDAVYSYRWAFLD